MSDENKTNNPYTGTSKLSDYDITSMLSDVKEGDMQILARLLVEMKNQNEETQKRVKLQSYFSIGAAVICVILLIVVLTTVSKLVPQIEGAVANANTLITAVNEEVGSLSTTVNDEVAEVTKAIDEAVVMVNQTSAMVEQATGIMNQATDIANQTTEIIGQANTMMGEVQTVVANVDKSTQEIAATDINGMLDNVNSLVATSEKSVQDTVKKIDDVDIESLNKAINDLSTIIAPLAKLFKR